MEKARMPGFAKKENSKADIMADITHRTKLSSVIYSVSSTLPANSLIIVSKTLASAFRR